MNDLADLHRAVQATLAEQRLGRPVFVRYHWLGPDPPDGVAGRLAQLAALVSGWLGQELDRVHANATADRNQIALTLEFQAGGTALIGFSHHPHPEVRVDLMVLGNRGALYQEDAAFLLGDQTATAPLEPPAPRIRERIDQALAKGMMFS